MERFFYESRGDEWLSSGWIARDITLDFSLKKINVFFTLNMVCNVVVVQLIHIVMNICTYAVVSHNKLSASPCALLASQQTNIKKNRVKQTYIYIYVIICYLCISLYFNSIVLICIIHRVPSIGYSAPKSWCLMSSRT